jgi:hypothetical protein
MKRLLLWLLEVATLTEYGKTGTKATHSGIWRSGKEFIALTKGERFPPCKNDWWILVVSVS